MSASELELDGTILAIGWDDLRYAANQASDQNHVTWLTEHGRRIAAVVPVGVAEHGSLDRFSAAVLIANMARQVEEIHRALGLETDADGGRVHAALLTCPQCHARVPALNADRSRHKMDCTEPDTASDAIRALYAEPEGLYDEELG